tara:strand:- start:225 stop:746 length:522 start_codon:yes stop_codon:yes gene_type:complete
MIKLINGRGQLGDAMKKHLRNVSFYKKIKKNLNREVLLYHTWIFEDKSKIKQKQQFQKFISFIEKNKEKHIVFTSTYSEKENWYNHYKQLAEAFLISNCKSCLVIRIPTIIGKGICEKIKNSEVNVYGKMNLISLDKAAKEILNLCSYEGLIKSVTIQGEKIKAKTVKALYSI